MMSQHPEERVLLDLADVYEVLDRRLDEHSRILDEKMAGVRKSFRDELKAIREGSDIGMGEAGLDRFTELWAAAMIVSHDAGQVLIIAGKLADLALRLEGSSGMDTLRILRDLAIKMKPALVSAEKGLEPFEPALDRLKNSVEECLRRVQ